MCDTLMTFSELQFINTTADTDMELKTWLLIIRILNFICSGMLIGFQIWYIVELILGDTGVYGIMLQIWAPFFLIIFAFLILAAEFRYEKIVEYFKFLQTLPGLAFFNLFIASIMAFQFSDFNQTASIVLASLFTALAVIILIFGCLKPTGGDGLLMQE